MKNIITLLFVLISLAAFTQQDDNFIPTVLERGQQGSMIQVKDQIGDFTITDSDGVTWHLYDLLAQGKTVFLDLFFTTCVYCQQYAPIIEQVYQNTGANQGDIIFLGLSPQDNNAQINAYKVNYGVSNPCAGTQGNGPAAIDITIYGQNFLGYPTYCVVCPDKTLYFDVCYPPSVACFNPYFANCTPPVTAAFTADTTAGCAPLTIQYTDQSAGIVTSWNWTFEGGTPATSNLENPVVTYDDAGSFDVTLVVSDGTNTNTLVKQDYITAHPLPVVTLTVQDTLCVNWPAFMLTGGSPMGGVYSGPGVGNGMFDPTAAGTGSHTITYTYTDIHNCTNSATATVVVDACTGTGEPETLPFSIYPNPVRDHLSILFNGSTRASVRLLNILGREVYSRQVEASAGKPVRIELGSPGAGIYFLVVESGNQSTVKKIQIVE